ARLQPDDGDLVARLSKGVIGLLELRVFVVNVEYACYPHADTSLNGFCDTKGSSLRGRAADRQAGARRPAGFRVTRFGIVETHNGLREIGRASCRDGSADSYSSGRL